MKKILSMLTAFVMAVTIIAVPVTQNAYGNTESGSVIESEIVDFESEEVVVELDSDQYVYTGKEIKPVLSVDGTILKEDTDYVVESYENNINVGTATMVIEGKGIYTGKKELTFEIVAADLSKSAVTFAASSYAYSGKEQKPEPVVTYNGMTLKKDVDYSIESYSSNIYPGTASVKLIGQGNFTGSKTADFYITSVVSLASNKRTTSTITLTWTKNLNVTGYEIQMYKSSSKTWETVATIKDKNTTTYAKKDLSSGTTYKFQIRTYVDASDGRHYGEWSETLSTGTTPGKVTISSLTTNVKMELKIKWKKKSGSGYQVYVSRDSKFSKPSKYDVKSASKLSKTVKAGKNNKYYYVKVRAYKVIDGKKVYGAWSSVKKIKTDGTGWATFSGCKYYYKNGKPLTGTRRISGSQYYFSKKGVLLGASSSMYKHVKDQTSKTDYLISISRTKNRLCVYHKVDGQWVVKYYWKCSTGAPGLISPISKTPSGVFTVPAKTTHKKYFGDSKGYRCWYATRITKGYYIHSITYQPYSSTRIQDGRLGQNVSHGCVRISKDNALWVYKNIDAGTKIVILGVS